MKKLLVLGDSFSSSMIDHSWINLLRGYKITNLSTNGASQYRIYKKLINLQIQNYDAIIVVHTSPNRIFIKDNPLYRSHPTHNSCDLIYTDLLDKKGSLYADNVLWWFENIFDLEEAQDIHYLLIENCMKKTSNIKNIHITFFDIDYPGLINLHHIWKKFPGEINHLNKNGNQKVASFLQNILN